MEAQVSTTIQLMQNNEVIYTIKIQNIDSYCFIFDSHKLATLSFTVSNLNMKDLDILVSKPYEHYILMAKKKVLKDNKEQLFEIPPRVYKYMKILDNGEEITFIFQEHRSTENELN